MGKKVSQARRGGCAELPLAALPKGGSGVILSVDIAEGCARRLTELGFFPGETVEKVLESPLGDPCAYRIRGAVIALRKADAEKITVRTGKGKWI